MTDMRHTVGKGMLGAVATGSAFAGNYSNWFDPFIRSIMFYGGAVGVILTCISLALDIRRKWRKWQLEREMDKDEATTTV